MKYTIKKGSHYSGLHFGLNLNNVLLKECSFDSSCFVLANPSDPADPANLDLNKLIGFSNGYHMRNSARIGWRYNDGTKMIDLFAYMHIDGKIFSMNDFDKIYLCSVEPGDKFDVAISAANKTYFFGITLLGQLHQKFFPMGKKAWSFGYKLFPYFGGTLTAPQKMTIIVD